MSPETTPVPQARATDGIWDLLVIGGGSAGIVAAKTAAGLGADVLLVERDRMGGDCLNTGCVPSKALLASAHAAHEAREAASLGVHVSEVRVDFTAVREHVRSAIQEIEPTDSAPTLRAAGVQVVLGAARFVAADEVDVVTAANGPARVRFRHAVVATGSRPAVPSIPGLDPSRVLTSDTVWELSELPARLAVLGGGAIGCELGQAFARLGSQVTLVEAGKRILPRESDSAAACLVAQLRADGVRLMTDARVDRMQYEARSTHLHLAGDQVVEADAVLVATGRDVTVDGLDLEAAGVEYDARGVVVDDRLRTTNHRVLAAGDVTGHPQFTHVAGVFGSVAASNAVLGLRRTADVDLIPRVTFTHPEVASFGVGSDDARAQGLRVRTIAHRHLDRAIAETRRDGFTDLVLDRRGRVLGATIVGPRAGESLPELVLAASHGLRARDLAGVMHAYPTYADAPWQAAIADVQAQLGATATRAAIAGLRRLQRRRGR